MTTSVLTDKSVLNPFTIHQVDVVIRSSGPTQWPVKFRGAT